MVHHGFRSKEARRARKPKHRLRPTTSLSSPLVTCQGDGSRKLYQAFLLDDSLNFNFVDEERSDIGGRIQLVTVLKDLINRFGMLEEFSKWKNSLFRKVEVYSLMSWQGSTRSKLWLGQKEDHFQ